MSATIAPEAEPTEDREYSWSEGSYELAGVCACGDFSCESSWTGQCVNAEP